MNKQYLIALIEVDSDKLTQITGGKLAVKMSDLKTTIATAGTCDYYAVKDVNAFKRFQAEIKRLNP